MQCWAGTPYVAYVMISTSNNSCKVYYSNKTIMIQHNAMQKEYYTSHITQVLFVALGKPKAQEKCVLYFYSLLGYW